jgi:hypothetical protein
MRWLGITKSGGAAPLTAVQQNVVPASGQAQRPCGERAGCSGSPPTASANGAADAEVPRAYALFRCGCQIDRVEPG